MSLVGEHIEAENTPECKGEKFKWRKNILMTYDKMPNRIFMMHLYRVVIDSEILLRARMILRYWFFY